MARTHTASACLVAVVVGAGLLGPATTSSSAPAPPRTTTALTSVPSSPGSGSPAAPTATPDASREATTSPSSDSPSPTGAAQTPSEAPRPSAAPDGRVAWIEVGAVGIRAPVSGRGLSPDGRISPPQGTMMWFTGNDRVMPGLVGTAVVAGHVAHGDAPDVFAKLPELRPGEQVRVGYRDGSVLELTVTKTDVVDKEDLRTNPDVWGANTTIRRVVLITCDDALGFRSDGHRVANFVAVAEA